MSNILYRSRSNYTQVPNDIIFDTRLTAQAKGVAAYLFSRPVGWKFYEAEITSHFANQRDGIRSALKNLIETGYLKILKERNEKGQLTGCVYSVRASLSEPFVDVADVGSADVGKTDSGKSDTNNTDSNNTDSSNTDSKSPHTPQGADDGFGEFCNAYPKHRRLAVGKCRELWAHKKLSAQKDKIIAFVKNQLRSGDWVLDGDRKKFVPHMITFLRSERWDTGDSVSNEDLAEGIDKDVVVTWCLSFNRSNGVPQDFKRTKAEWAKIFSDAHKPYYTALLSQLLVKPD